MPTTENTYSTNLKIATQNNFNKKNGGFLYNRTQIIIARKQFLSTIKVETHTINKNKNFIISKRQYISYSNYHEHTKETSRINKISIKKKPSPTTTRLNKTTIIHL